MMLERHQIKMKVVLLKMAVMCGWAHLFISGCKHYYQYSVQIPVFLLENK